MIDVFLEPMFDRPEILVGFTLGEIILALGVVGALVGLIAIHRIVRVDPEPRIFRATTRPEPTQIATRVGAITFAAIALVAFLVGR